MTPATDSAHWAHALATFDDVIALDADTRGRRLAEIARSDPALRQSVDVLMAADASADVRLAALDRAFGHPSDRDVSGEADEDPLSLAGHTISHFRILEPLAVGGMGVVYRAEDLRLNRAIALKCPLPSLHFDRKAKARFLREARLTSGIDHPNVCDIYEAGEADDGHVFYAMPLYDGETLKARLARTGALAVDAALAIAEQIAQGLRAAHSVNVVHGDLKPANVMLLRDDAVKILDFGLARAIDPTVTVTRPQMGTASYLAPEQVHGHAADMRSDLWALGVVVYEMLTGRRPFEGEHAVSIAHAIVHNDTVPPSSVRRDLDARVDDVVLTLLSKDPRKRYTSADEAAMALRAIAARGPHTWRNRVWSRLGSRSGRRALVGVAAAFVLGAALLSRGGTATISERRVVLLPFEVIGEDSGDSHLALALPDLIGTELSRLRGLVVSRSESNAMRPTLDEPATTPEIILAGTVQRANGTVVVYVRLIEADEATPRWSARYARAADQLHGIVAEAAAAIAEEMDVIIDRGEHTRLQRPLTRSARAFELYARGREVQLRAEGAGSSGTKAEWIQEAQSLYARARDADPEFAVARARLALVLLQGAKPQDTTVARREQARLEAEAALRLRPDLSEAHEALASYWAFGRRDVAKAIESAGNAVAGMPNHAPLRVMLGTLYRGAGRYDDAVAEFERAMVLDPRLVRAPVEAAFTLVRMRRDEDAMRAFDRATALAPDAHMLRVIKGHTYLRWKGIADTLAAVLATVPAEWDPDGMATWARFTVLRVQRRDREALAMLDRSRSALSRDGLVYQPIDLMRAQSHESLGDARQARRHYEAARRVLQDSVARHPRDASIRVALGLAHAGLRRRADAIRDARRAMDLAPLSGSNTGATAFMGVSVEILGRVGELDEAFTLLELLLSIPAGREVTIPFLQLWPGFDPLRSDARFDRLLERFATS